VQQHKFKVHLCDFSCEQLGAQGEVTEAYLKIDFDGVRAFKTETEHEPHEWGFRASFHHVVNNLEQLGKREIKVQCFNKHASGHMIGATSIDLQTVVCGPSHYQLTLRGGDGKEARGVVKFTCVMKMISSNLTVTCQDLTLTMLGCYASARLQISSTLEERDSKTRVAQAPHSQQGSWPGPFSFSFETTLKDLLKAPAAESLRFVVIDEMGVRQGEAHLEFRKAFSTKAGTPIGFKVPVTYTCTVEGEEEPSPIGAVGELEGVVLYEHLPIYAQLVNGLYIDGQVEHGHWFIEGLPYPSCMAEPPPVWQDPIDRTGFESLLPDHQQGDEDEEQTEQTDEHEHVSKYDFDDRTMMEALAQIDLPPPWEKRRERAGSRMYFLDTRSRRMTWKDPRFLPENWDQRIDPQTGKVYFQYHKTRQTCSIDPRGCPPGWEMRISKNGEVYFAHLPAMRTTFIDPRGLPEQSEAALDDLGRIYFKNHETKATTWEDPRDHQQEVVLAKWRHQQSISWWKEQVMREIEQRVEEEKGRDLENLNEEDEEDDEAA